MVDETVLNHERKKGCERKPPNTHGNRQGQCGRETYPDANGGNGPSARPSVRVALAISGVAVRHGQMVRFL